MEDAFNRTLKFSNYENFMQSGNFIKGLYYYINYKLVNCSNNCVICDSMLGYQAVKPTICDKELCKHSLSTYGIGIDIMGELNHNPKTIDLLLSLLHSGATMSQNNSTREMDPFPFNIHEKYNFGKKGSKKAYSKILKVVNLIPSIDSMIKLAKNDKKLLKSGLSKYHELAFPLLRWTISSNRSYLAIPPKNLCIKQIPKHIQQFLMISGSPEKEIAFRKLKKKNGSFYGFHGSRIGNWSNILRVGLKNYSGTSKMSAGAAYGNGVYFAKAMGTSLGYMGRSNVSF